jgi:hypothetical protein
MPGGIADEGIRAVPSAGCAGRIELLSNVIKQKRIHKELCCRSMSFLLSSLKDDSLGTVMR